jgi:photosystem II stability/assembly factor-like uncharacterized protein
MHNKINFFIFIQLFILTNPCFPQGNWELILPPYPTSNQLVSLDFIDAHTGLAVGEYGTIVKTTDGGEIWKLVEIPWMDYLLDVDLVDNQVCYAVGQNGQIIKSTDGGESWEKQSVKYTNNLNRIRFRDENNGWIIGEKGLILHTTNGGSEWHQQVSNSRGDLKGIDLMNESRLCIVGTKSTILISFDDGKCWILVDFETSDSSRKNKDFDFNDVFFTNDTLGWIGGAEFLSNHGIILKTINGGQSWFEESHNVSTNRNEYCGKGWGTSSYFPHGIQQIYFKDLQHGLCLSKRNYGTNHSNIPFYTYSGGEQWAYDMHGCREYSNQNGRFFFLTNDTVINTCYGGEFRFSYDGGYTWAYPNYDKRMLYNIIIGNEGRLLVQKKLSEGYVHIFSNDFGRNWYPFTPQVFDSTGNMIDIDISPTSNSIIDDRETLWIINSGQLFKSKDFGLTWHFIRGGISKEYYFEKFLTPDTLISYGLRRVELAPDSFKSELIINVSFDGGKTGVSKQFQGLWNDVTRPLHFLDKRAYDSYFFNGHTGFIVGSDGNILKTTDTGLSFESIYSGVIEDLFDVEFIDDSTGFIVGEFGRILKTEDRGSTWRKTNSGTQENIYCIGFKNKNEGWVGTESGLRYTIDDGENWVGVPIRYYNGLVRYIKFDIFGNGYAYTPFAKHSWRKMGIDKVMPRGYTFLLCMENDGTFVEDDPVDNNFPGSIKLRPNYPNPFNLRTKVVYRLPETGSVSLKIYNISGQLVRVLVDETQKSGEHAVLWDGLMDNGVEVTSGVYFYRLESGQVVKTRKMVILR